MATGTGTLETVMGAIVTTLNTALTAQYDADRICTRDIGEDDQKIAPSQTPRLYLWRGAQEPTSEDQGDVLSKVQFTVTILARCTKDDSGTLQTMINNAESVVLDALLADSGSIVTHTTGAIQYAIAYTGSSAPDYGKFEAYTDMKFDLLFARR
jgi:hypothetical protein